MVVVARFECVGRQSGVCLGLEGGGDDIIMCLVYKVSRLAFPICLERAGCLES